MIEKDAKKFAPVDTGLLRRAIVSTHTVLASKVISRAEYSAYVNYGTRKQRPQPFFTNAVNVNKNKILRNIQKAIKANLS